MRKVGRHIRKKKKKILIIGSLSLLLFLCVGYAAFSTQLSLRAKGNIKQRKTASEVLLEKVVESGDGLYKDIYEDGRYIFKGANPNNYITFNNEMWRIISVEEDGSIKILKNESIGSMQWDTSSSCPLTYNKIKKENYLTIVDNIIFLAGDIYDGCSNWNYATLKSYLNETYFNELSTNRNNIITYEWKVGTISQENDDLSNQILDESKKLWNGKVGLITVSEYLRANTNIEQCGNILLNNANRTTCVTTNWMYTSLNTWSISAVSSTQGTSTCIQDSNFIWNLAVKNSVEVYPSVYLSSNIVITGDGTESVPYQIEN